MENGKNDRLRTIAAALDCVLEADLADLADVSPATVEDWAKRRKGPPYVRLGLARLYPRKALQKYLEARIREPHAVSAAEVL